MPLPDSQVLDQAADALTQSVEQAPASAKLAWATDFLITRTERHKVVVFSQSVRLLELLALRLLEAGVRHEKMQGNMVAGERKDKVDAFQHDPGVRVLLCSIRVAGVGITLTSADTVLIMDPWWNKPVEDQAIDRVHRIGQTQPVEVVRLVAQDTVEELMLTVQDFKHGIFERAMSQKGREVQHSRLDIVLNIFRGPWATPKVATAKRGAKRKHVEA